MLNFDDIGAVVVPDGTDNMVQVIGEIKIDLSEFVSKGNVHRVYPIDGSHAPPNTFMDCLICVSLLKEGSQAPFSPQKSAIYTSYLLGVN